ncbi:cytochrome P460 family protein [Kaarinaea lacus]
MNKPLKYLATLFLFTAAGRLIAAEPADAPNGIAFPADYTNWQVIGSSHRIDNKTLRVILGNEIAVKAARSGNINPWPKGAMLGKVVWKEGTDAHWPTAIVPKEFVHAEFMLKDADKYSSTGGWGYARWVGKDLKVYGKDAGFANECVACHTPVKEQDYVFTRPAPLYNGMNK